jgi:hypothetical protein
MKKLTILLMTFTICSSSFGQPKTSIEISLVDRYDKHADYISNFAGRAYNDTNRLYGFSHGISGIFRKNITKSNCLYLGIGYYQLTIDKIRGPMPFNIPGTRTARNINYRDPGGTDLLYSTTQYRYNDIAFTLGFDKEIQLKNHFKFDIAAEAIGYKTFSQKYRIGYSSKYYITHNNKPLEFGININAGIVKEYRSFYLRPSIIIPIYQNLKGDKVFYEDPKMNIPKWFNGFGLSLKIGKYISADRQGSIQQG